MPIWAKPSLAYQESDEYWIARAKPKIEVSEDYRIENNPFKGEIQNNQLGINLYINKILFDGAGLIDPPKFEKIIIRKQTDLPPNYEDVNIWYYQYFEDRKSAADSVKKDGADYYIFNEIFNTNKGSGKYYAFITKGAPSRATQSSDETLEIEQAPPPGSEDDKISKLQEINRMYGHLRNLISGNCGLNPTYTDIQNPANSIDPFLQAAALQCNKETGERNGSPNPFWAINIEWDSVFKKIFDKIDQTGNILNGGSWFGAQDGFGLTEEGKKRLQAIESQMQTLANAIKTLDELGVDQATYDKAKILNRHWDYELDGKVNPYFLKWEDFKTKLQKMIDLYTSNLDNTLPAIDDPCQSTFLEKVQNPVKFSLCMAASILDQIATALMKVGLAWIKRGVGL